MPDPITTAIAAAAGPAGPVAAVGIDLVLDVLSTVMREVEIANANKEIVTGAELCARAAARLAAASEDPGLPPEVRIP